MKQYTLIIIIALFSSITIAQNNAILDLQSTNQTAFQLPSMTETQRLAMDMTGFTDEEGILVFDKTNRYIYYYNSFINDWAQMGDSNAESPVGPGGPIGNSAVGQQGPPGTSGYHCWDVNQNGISDASENIVPYGIGPFNGYDCRGPHGDLGLFGEQGENGPDGQAGAQGAQGPGPGVTYSIVEFTTTTNSIQTVYSSLFTATGPSERIFVQPIGSSPLVDVAKYGNNTWWLKTRNNSTMPAGASYKIIRVP